MGEVMEFDAGSTRLAVAKRGRLEIFDLSNGQWLSRGAPPCAGAGPVRSASWAPGGRFLAVCGEASVIVLEDRGNDWRAAPPLIATSRPCDVAFAPTSLGFLAVASRDGCVTLYERGLDPQDGECWEPVSRMECYHSSDEARDLRVRWDPCDATVAVCCLNYACRPQLWRRSDFGEWDYTTLGDGQEEAVLDLAFAPSTSARVMPHISAYIVQKDAQRTVAYSTARAIHVHSLRWDDEDSERVATVPTSQPATRLLWNKAGTLLAASSGTGTAVVYKADVHRRDWAPQNLLDLASTPLHRQQQLLR